MRRREEPMEEQNREKLKKGQRQETEEVKGRETCRGKKHSKKRGTKKND